MKCVNCSNDVQFGFNFCPYCGEDIPKGKTCESCGMPMDKSFKFCPDCGNASTRDKNSGAAIKDSVIKTGEFVGRDKIIVGEGTGRATKSGLFCTNCRRLLKDDYFKCKQCEELYCILCYGSPEEGLCNACFPEKTEGNCFNESVSPSPQFPQKTTRLYTLRKNSITVLENDDFQLDFLLDGNNRPLNYLTNDYHDNEDGTVTDQATGLIWQKTGSSPVNYKAAQQYISTLNGKGFAGYNDWRLPTVTELMSLLEPSKKNGSLFIDPVFNIKQTVCWSCDKASPGRAWHVNFGNGSVIWHNAETNCYVRGVRCRQ